MRQEIAHRHALLTGCSAAGGGTDRGPSSSVKLTGRRCRVETGFPLVLDEPPVGVLDACPQVELVPPPETMEAGDVEELAWRAVGLRRVEGDDR